MGLLPRAAGDHDVLPALSLCDLIEEDLELLAGPGGDGSFAWGVGVRLALALAQTRLRVLDGLLF